MTFHKAAAGEWLSLAAAPTFALMALLSAAAGPGPADVLCAGDAHSPTGMVAMYLLMSVFHLAAWLKLAGSRRG